MEYSVITGFDPLIVALYDQSQSRSFPIVSLKYDFGDDVIYGALDSERSSSLTSAGFVLPGDDAVVSGLSLSTIECLTGIGEVLNRPIIMNPALPSTYRTNSGISIHYTGVRFTSGDSNVNGDVLYVSADRMECMAGSVVPISISGMTPISDDCNRTNCGFDPDAGSDVAHIYKGAGIYLASLGCSSLCGLEGWELSSSNFSGIGDSSAYCLVKVYPTCPCIYVDVYGTGENKADFVTITADNFSCDDMSTFASCTGYVNAFDVSGFTGVSGYAPFLKIAASGRIVPRSLPVTGSIWNWSDWYSDYILEDQQNHGMIKSGWPNWETEFDYDVESRSITADSEHVYVMPGVYSVGLYPKFDVERISAVMGDIPISYCMDDAHRNSRAVSADCVMVREIPPKGGEIVWDEIDEVQYPTVVSGISVTGLSSGSFPIARLDWDFGDGSEIITVSRYFSDTYSGIVTDSTTGLWIDSATAQNYWSGVDGDGYSERDPRNLEFAHEYNRTELMSYPSGYVVSVTAFACNTDTSIVLTASMPSASMPVFEEIEGTVKIIDSKLERDGNSIFVLESEKQGRIYTLRTIE